MGYLDNSTVTVDAILTTKGRQILAAGGNLDIVKFALSDDEIDYDLWNPTHTLGTNYYGAVIENMPILEGLPDESQMMRYKLVTLNRTGENGGFQKIPILIANSNTSIVFTSLTQKQTITPTLTNLVVVNPSYTAILSDTSVANLMLNEAAGGTLVTPVGSAALTANVFLDDEPNAVGPGKTKTVVGRSFILSPSSFVSGGIKYALLTVICNNTGAYDTVQISVDPSNFNASPANQSGTLGQTNQGNTN